MFQRILSQKVADLSEKFPVVALLGPRQSGKTTLTKTTFPNNTYVSLEDIDTREFAKTDPRGFLEQYHENVIIDEIQHVPELMSYIQDIVDAERKNGRFILTGSHNYLLQESLGQSLAGRVAIATLLPLSLEELKPDNTSLETRLYFGSYPRIYDQNIPPQDWYPNYIRTYIERDIRLIKNISDLSLFQKFIKLCAGRTGQVLNLSSLATDTGVSHNTISSWISILESSYIIFLLRPHHKNFSKRMMKMPKLYFYDTGLACSLLDIQNEKQVSGHYLFGGLFESFIMSEIVKYRFNRGLTFNGSYWRDKTGHEVDCVLDFPNNLVPIEMKAGKTIGESFFPALEYWLKLASMEAKEGIIFYGGKEKQLRERIKIYGWQSVPEILAKTNKQ